jgi:hypothetical protein
MYIGAQQLAVWREIAAADSVKRTFDPAHDA